MRLGALAHERVNRCGQGCPKRPELERADVGVLEASERVGGQIVVAARLHRGPSLAEAGQRERVVAHGADAMLGLPDTSTLDARARVVPR
jgi:hypothetical protein